MKRSFSSLTWSGYTALTETHGNPAAAKAVLRYVEIAHSVLEPGARLVERVGDEVVIVGQDAACVVQTAITLRDAVEREPLFPMVRCGMHAGTVVQERESFIGSALNVTARVAAHARGGQILCTAPVTALAPGLLDVEYRSLGLVQFKNIVDPVSVFEVVVGRQDREDVVIDPVCRMQVRPDTAAARLPFGGRTYHFCSFECARAFAERPEDYTAGAPAA